MSLVSQDRGRRNLIFPFSMPPGSRIIANQKLFTDHRKTFIEKIDASSKGNRGIEQEFAKMNRMYVQLHAQDEVFCHIRSIILYRHTNSNYLYRLKILCR
jgi:hypothetical protein